MQMHSLPCCPNGHSSVSRMQCSTERLEFPKGHPWRIALRGALLIRDRPKLGAAPELGAVPCLQRTTTRRFATLRTALRTGHLDEDV
jgi:hypothetical protein